MASGTDHPGPPPAAAKIPLRLRLKAWWDGNELYLKRRERTPLPPGENEALKRQPGYQDPERPWETPRVRLLQAVWGEGFSVPGGRDHMLELVKPFGLNPAMSMLHIGAGLGGPARTFANEFGVWVSGFEADHELAEAGASLSTLAGMAKKAPITPIDLQNLELTINSFDAILATDVFFAVADKTRLLQVIEQALKQRGQLLFTDYVIRARSSENHPTVQAWAQQEPFAPQPWTADEYIQALHNLKLDIRITEDITASVRTMALQGWASYTAGASSADIDSEMAQCLVQEVDLWTRRVNAFDSGELRVYRIYAIKKVAEKMLSDW